MNCQGFEKISTIPELLICIYELLTFEDQLRLSRVNQQLKSIFLNFIHPKKYNFLQIKKTITKHYLVNGELGVNRLLLTPEELEEFVRVYAENVETLWDKAGLTIYDKKNQSRTIDVRIEQFNNLTSLRYVSQLIQEEHMQLIAASCPHLRELLLFDCNSTYDDMLRIIENSLNTKTLQQMKNLKTLVVDTVCVIVGEELNSFKYSVFRELVTKLNLECLKLYADLIPDLDDKETDYIHHHLKELNISTTFDCAMWENKFHSFLRNFENLSILSLSTQYHALTNAILDIIAKACKNVEKFTIERTQFRDIKQFSMPPKVTEFSVIYCDGLSHGNLKQLLTQFRIQKFESFYTDYLGELEDFSISPFIQLLDLTGVSTYKFPSAYVNNTNLKELHWDVNKDDDDGFNSCQDPGPLESCINLETLNMRNGFMPLNKILQLTHLQKLMISQNMPRLSWSYITALLKHPPLTELHVHASCYISDLDTDLLNSSDIPTHGFPTNMKILKINFVLFERGVDFWLDLLNQNLEMMCSCKSLQLECAFLKKLIRHNSFPRHMRTIDIYGFSIYCRDLSKNFNAAIKMLDRSMNRLLIQFRYEYKNLNCLVLNRKQ